jgi:hypothetical protein
MGVTKAAPARLIGELPLVGGGEAVDLARTLASHGVATLPWSATVRMVTRIVTDLGDAATDGRRSSATTRAWPSGST